MRIQLRPGMKFLAIIGLVGVLSVAALAETAAPVKIIGHVGETATVEGVVSDVHVAARSGVTFIDMGGRYPDNRFVAVIWSEDAGKFPNVGALYGKLVKITGKLKMYQGKQEIIIKDAGQLQTDSHVRIAPSQDQ